MKPTIGSTVFFFHRPYDAPQPALVVGVNSDTTANLHAFANHGNGDAYFDRVPYLERVDPAMKYYFTDAEQVGTGTMQLSGVWAAIAELRAAVKLLRDDLGESEEKKHA